MLVLPCGLSDVGGRQKEQPKRAIKSTWLAYAKMPHVRNSVNTHTERDTQMHTHTHANANAVRPIKQHDLEYCNPIVPRLGLNHSCAAVCVSECSLCMCAACLIVLINAQAHHVLQIFMYKCSYRYPYAYSYIHTYISTYVYIYMYIQF